MSSPRRTLDRMAADTPDQQLVTYAPLTTGLAQTLLAGQGSDTLAVLAAIGRLEIQVNLLLAVMRGQILGPWADDQQEIVNAILTQRLKDIETAMKTPR